MLTLADGEVNPEVVVIICELVEITSSVVIITELVVVVD